MDAFCQFPDVLTVRIWHFPFMPGFRVAWLLDGLQIRHSLSLMKLNKVWKEQLSLWAKTIAMIPACWMSSKSKHTDPPVWDDTVLRGVMCQRLRRHCSRTVSLTLDFCVHTVELVCFCGILKSLHVLICACVEWIRSMKLRVDIFVGVFFGGEAASVSRLSLGLIIKVKNNEEFLIWDASPSLSLLSCRIIPICLSLSLNLSFTLVLNKSPLLFNHSTCFFPFSVCLLPFTRFSFFSPSLSSLYLPLLSYSFSFLSLPLYCSISYISYSFWYIPLSHLSLFLPFLIIPVYITISFPPSPPYHSLLISCLWPLLPLSFLSSSPWVSLVYVLLSWVSLPLSFLFYKVHK